MVSTKEELETTVDCLINKVWELKNLLKVSMDKTKSFQEQIETYKEEARKLDDLEAKNFALSKENKILKDKIKELEEKVKTKEKVKNIMKELNKNKE